MSDSMGVTDLVLKGGQEEHLKEYESIQIGGGEAFGKLIFKN